MAQLDQIINEIATVLGITREDVSNQFTEEDLKALLEHSKCEPTADTTTPLFDSLDIPCGDLGAPLLPNVDPVTGVSSDTNIDEVKDSLNRKNKNNKSPDVDVTKCIATVGELNKEIEANLDLSTQYRIILERIQELKDNIVGLDFYFQARIDRVGTVLKDFEPNLITIKNYKADIASNNKKIKKNADRLTAINKVLTDSNKSTYEAELTSLKSRNTSLVALNKNISTSIKSQELIIKGKTAKYPSFSDDSVDGALGSIGALNDAVKGILDNSDIKDINDELENYSEFVKVKKYSSNRSSFSEILSSSLIQFEVEFQDLNFMEIEKEVINEDTGDAENITKTVLIKNSPLLENNSFFTGVPGYIITDKKRKKSPDGTLYEDYYNLLEDPLNEFFTLAERGLTESEALIDPTLVGTDNTTKKENDKEYYIQDLKRLQDFYENFDKTFSEKREVVRDRVVKKGTVTMKSTLTKLAKLDVDAILAIGRVNLYLPEDDSQLKTITDKIRNADSRFAGVIGNMNSEIERIKDKIEELEFTPEKIKAKLKEMNSPCFEHINKDEEDTIAGKPECEDAKKLLGSDVFFESMTGSDPKKEPKPICPDFTQLCYWKEFAKIANIMGLFPIPNTAQQLRYWPVGLEIYVPAPIKIPLPIIWIPLLTFSSPAGVTVLFLTINGIFISPVMFFMSSSGFKQHIVMLKGSSDKFGYDKSKSSIKETISLPISVLAKSAKAARGNKSIDEILTAKEKADIANLEAKKDGASPETIAKIDEEIAGIKENAENREISDLEKTKAMMDKKESIADTIKKTKTSIFKRIEDIGNPVMSGINKLKEKSSERRDKLQKSYVKAVEEGNTKVQKEIKEKMKSDGLSLEEKKDAIAKDILSYFDRLDMPSFTLPEEKGKINPKLTGNEGVGEKIEDESSNKMDELLPNSKSKVLTNLTLSIAKYKEDIEELMESDALSLDDELDAIKDMLKKMSKKIAEKSYGKDKIAPVGGTAAPTIMDNARKSKDKNALSKAEGKINKALDNDLVKHTMGVTPAIISSLGKLNVAFDPFSACCTKEEIQIGVPFNPIIVEAFKQGVDLLSNKIDSMSKDDFKTLFGGKNTLTGKDIRLGLLSLVKIAVPESLGFPKPPINLSSIGDMFGGLLGSLQMPQASFPTAMKALSMPKQVKIDLNIVKSPLKSLLEKAIAANIETALSQSIASDFNNINSKDLKAYLKNFITDNIDSMESKIKPFYKLVSIAKSAKGLGLNTIEKSAFATVPYGKAIEVAYTAYGVAQMNLPNSLAYSAVDIEALKPALKLVQPLLKPIVSTPIVYPLVAGAGVIGKMEGIRLLNPVLNQDDLPPWERLSPKNVLFLAFIDEFITNAADNIGFYRNYLP